ncbi:MAG: hypothetical protein P4L40_14130 [Terracidiphilus sp.]|nr:hypothetical protein [Terracidiphilus sp.]
MCVCVCVCVCVLCGCCVCPGGGEKPFPIGASPVLAPAQPVSIPVLGGGGVFAKLVRVSPHFTWSVSAFFRSCLIVCDCVCQCVCGLWV